MSREPVGVGALQSGPSRPGTLYLVPVDLGGGDPDALLPQRVLGRLSELRRFVVESPKRARSFLKAAGYRRPLREAVMTTLDEHTAASELPLLLAPLLAGEDCGLMSEAGCPAVADPGAALVRLAHEHGVRVVPLVGPSAVLLALMASGMSGQHFVFHGYLPVDAARRARRVRELEEAAERTGATQIFIETPYRNEVLFQAILEQCRAETMLCIAVDLTLPSESVTTRAVAQWKKERPSLNRRPAVFLLSREL